MRWDTVVLPIVRGGVKILDPQWQASALLIKLLVRALSVGYEPWKALVRFRVEQTQQFWRGSWPANSNWIMNARNLVKKRSKMWQGVLKAWQSIQSGIEQHDPTTWDEITRQPLFGNRFLTNEQGIQWGTETNTNLKIWAEKNIKTVKDLMKEDGNGWKQFREHTSLRRCRGAAALHNRIIHNIPWEPALILPATQGLWVARKKEDGHIHKVSHITKMEPLEATAYNRLGTEQLKQLEHNCALPNGQYSEVCIIIRCGGVERNIIDFNPKEDDEPELTLWIWGDDWVNNLAWDPKEWQWRRIGVLADTNILNYCTKRGYRVALRQNNHTMKVDAELEEAGYNSKARAKFFNRIWHPYLPRKSLGHAVVDFN